MESDVFHHWAMLRPLFVFLMALPLLIAALWLDAREERRKRSAAQALASSAANVASAKIDTRSRDGRKQQASIASTRAVGEQPVGIEAAYPAVKKPREWDGGPLRPNYNRQSILGGGRSGGALR